MRHLGLRQGRPQARRQGDGEGQAAADGGADLQEPAAIEAIGQTPQGVALQKAWLELEVVQCGYCQSGQIMSAAALLAQTPKPTDDDIDAAMSGNVCRCGTYQRIRAAIHKAAA